MFAIAAWRKEPLFGLLRQHAGTYLMLGIIGTVAFNVFFFYALRYTSANDASLIMATNPLVTTLLAIVILGERPTSRHLLALPIALVGVTVVITQGEISHLLNLQFSIGDILMLAADGFWALYNVLCRRYMPQASPLANTTWIMASGALVLFCIALAGGTHLTALGPKASAAITVMVIGGTVLAYLFWTTGIARLGAARTAIFLNLVPVFAMLLSTAIESPPTSAQVAGGLLVIFGVIVSMLPSRSVATA
jgi:drug/metabolite transporter (DMT)-like permease